MTTPVEKYIPVRPRVVRDAPKVAVLVFEVFRSTPTSVRQNYQGKAVQDTTLAGIFFEGWGANSYRTVIPSLTLCSVFNLMQATKRFLFLSD